VSLQAIPLAWVLGYAVAAFLWKGLCIQAVVAVLLAQIRPQDTRTRYMVLCLALFLCVAVLVADVIRMYGSVSMSGGATDVAVGLTARPAFELAPMVPAAWPFWLALAWLAGVVLMMLRLFAGMAWLRGLVQASQPWTDAAWQVRVAGMARQLRLPREVGLRVVQGLSSPVTAGWLKPVLLVPASVITGMPADLLEALLAHELAHIRRYDYLINLLQHIAEALLFFHPSVWWLSRRVRVERERIADEMAAALIGNPHRLAHALNALSTHTAADETRPRLAQRASDGQLADRIRRLVRPAKPATRSAWAISLLAAAWAVVGVCGWSALDQTRMQAFTWFGARHVALPGFPSIDALVDASGAAHVLVVDSHSGEKLIGRAEDDMVPIASLTKLVTAMVVLDAAPDLTRRIRIVEEDAEATKAGVSQLPVGTVTTLDTLLKLALMSSDNRAAHALARSYPGGASAFVGALQRKTAALGLQHTTLHEPTGLSPDNRSTASDIERIVRAAADYPAIARDTILPAETVNIGGGVIQYRNTNPLVGRRGWDIQLSKTATSAGAGRCLVMRVRLVDRDLTLVLLNGRRAPA
jgi:D-alanyl-D-alanine endopeptidase (penicillin-binding protein 7)